MRTIQPLRLLAVSLAGLIVAQAALAGQAANPVIGRWDLTITDGDRKFPSWIEFWMDGETLKGAFCAEVGGAYDVGEVKLDDNKIVFRTRVAGIAEEAYFDYEVFVKGDTLTGGRAWKERKDTIEGVRFVPKVDPAGTWQINLADKLTAPSGAGTLLIKQADGKIKGQFTLGDLKDLPVEDTSLEGEMLKFSVAMSVPSGGGGQFADRYLFDGQIKGDVLEGRVMTSFGKQTTFKAERQREWAEPIALFNGKDLDGWQPLGDPNNFLWKVIDGVMVNDGYGANIVSVQKFKDFKFHIEFRVPQHGNSGVYLRGRYEVQVADSFGQEPSSGGCGGLYSRVTPSVNASKPPGEWQTFEGQIIGQYITVALNGTKIIDNHEIRGITGGALDSHEHEPGPIYLQGDHGKIEYRKLIITPVK